MDQLRKLMLFRLPILVIQSKKTDYDKKMVKLKIKYLIMIMQYVTTQEFNKLTADYFTARLRQESVATKADINDFVGNTDYNYKLKNS